VTTWQAGAPARPQGLPVAINRADSQLDDRGDLDAVLGFWGPDPVSDMSPMEGRPIGSSGEVRQRYAGVTAWEDGKVVRATNYSDIDDARAAAERLAKERG
jgi:hypothetical protein